MEINFHFIDLIPLNKRQALKAFIEKIFKSNSQKVDSVEIIFCDDNYLLQLNKDFLHHDYFTDILTFTLSEPGKPLSAEIYISTEMVRFNAHKFNSTLKAELHRVIFHGILHLIGMKDSNDKEKDQIRKREDQL